MKNSILYILLAVMVLASCGTHKTAVGDPNAATATLGRTERAFMAKVIDGAVTTENVVGKADVTLKLGTKKISVPGAVHMRKDKVIRIQLFMPFLGTEVGRLEFTPDYVLVMDRMNKQYIKGDYNQLDFLRENGLSFYSLQALFWNQLTAPGRQRVAHGDASLFAADMTAAGGTVPVTLDKGHMHYQWNVEGRSNDITSAVITYNGSGKSWSQVKWLYSDFTAFSGKRFPLTQSFSFVTSADGKKQQGEIMIEMKSAKNDAKWETETTVSPKYKKVSPEDVLSRLMKFTN